MSQSCCTSNVNIVSTTSCASSGDNTRPRTRRHSPFYNILWHIPDLLTVCVKLGPDVMYAVATLSEHFRPKHRKCQIPKHNQCSATHGPASYIVNQALSGANVVDAALRVQVRKKALTDPQQLRAKILSGEAWGTTSGIA